MKSNEGVVQEWGELSISAVIKLVHPLVTDTSERDFTVIARTRHVRHDRAPLLLSICLPNGSCRICQASTKLPDYITYSKQTVLWPNYEWDLN